LDDGARSLEESVAMVRIAAESGTTDIVATPHANLDYSFQPDLIAQRLVELRDAAPPGLRIHYGCDFHLAYDNVQDALSNPTKYAINHGSYLLVEFSDLAIFGTTTEIFDRLLQAGLVPVITHPERNVLLQKRADDLRRWAEMGVLLQVTGQSLLGRFGRRAAEFSEFLIDEQLVHCIASDAHDTRDRTPRLDDARQWLHSRYGEELASNLLVDNPGAMIHNKPLPARPEPAPRRKWYKFW
jgi:protein-tyrosine phosphatase